MKPEAVTGVPLAGAGKRPSMPTQTDETSAYNFIIDLIDERCRVRLREGKHQLIRVPTQHLSERVISHAGTISHRV